MVTIHIQYVCILCNNQVINQNQNQKCQVLQGLGICLGVLVHIKKHNVLM